MSTPRPSSGPPDPAAWSRERKIYLAVGLVILAIAVVLLVVSL